MLKEFLKAAHQPTVKLGTTEQLIEHLSGGTVNLALMVASGQHGSLATKSVKSYEFQTGYFKVLSRSGSFEDRIITTEDRPEVESFKKLLLKRKIRYHSQLQVESWNVGARLAQLGLGCCLLPDFVAMPNLKEIPLGPWRAKYALIAAVRNLRDLSPIEDALLATIRKNR